MYTSYLAAMEISCAVFFHFWLTNWQNAITIQGTWEQGCLQAKKAIICSKLAALGLCNIFMPLIVMTDNTKITFQDSFPLNFPS